MLQCPDSSVSTGYPMGYPGNECREKCSRGPGLPCRRKARESPGSDAETFTATTGKSSDLEPWKLKTSGPCDMPAPSYTSKT